jgi:2-oxo-4-hydroxy-4-carboxy-5-ureidoimidazoline decarboxylase
MSLESFNALPDDEADRVLADCCVSRVWIAGVREARPYASAADFRATAVRVWSRLEESDWLEAFEGHPKIGDVNSLKAKYASSGHLAAAEQSGVASAADAVIERLASGNRAYEERFGFIFIVCATGKSAEEMLALLEQRLDNERDEELSIAAEEQLKILLIRLEKLL